MHRLVILVSGFLLLWGLLALAQRARAVYEAEERHARARPGSASRSRGKDQGAGTS